MIWIKQNTLCKNYDVSPQTIKKLIKDGILKEKEHFKTFPFGLRYNIEAIENIGIENKALLDKIVDKILR